jgi:hypothetical protein
MLKEIHRKSEFLAKSFLRLFVKDMRHYAFGFPNSLQNVSGGSREQMFRDGIPFSEPKTKRGVNHKKRDRLPFYNDHSFVVLAERGKRVGFLGAHGPN